jgi:hypothetical protein
MIIWILNSWTEQTKERTIAAVVGTLLLNIILVYACNYINFVLIQGKSHENFFNGDLNFINWFFINFLFSLRQLDMQKALCLP